MRTGGGCGRLGLLDLGFAGAVLFRVGAQVFERLAVGALAEAAQRAVVDAAFDDLFADVGLRRGRQSQRQQGHEQRGQKGRPSWDRSALEASDSHTLTVGTLPTRAGEARRLPGPARSRAAQASWS